MLPLVVLAWKTFQNLLCSTPDGIREKGKSNKGLGGMELNQSGMPSGLPLVHLHPHLGGRTGRDEYGACVSKGQTKSNQGRNASV